MNRKELLQGYVAGDGHEDNVGREQLLADPGYHAGAGGEEGGNRQDKDYGQGEAGPHEHAVFHHRAGHYDKYIFNDQHRAKQYYSRLNEEEREERGYDNLGSTADVQVRGGEELAVGDCQGEEHLGSGVHVRVNKDYNTEADKTEVQAGQKEGAVAGSCMVGVLGAEGPQPGQYQYV